MTEKDRWLDADSAELGEVLLSAGRAEEPSKAALRRTLIAVGAGVATAAIAGKTAAATGTAAASLGAGSLGAGSLTAGSLGAAGGALPAATKSASALLLGKWLLGGAVVGATAISVVHLSLEADVPKVEDGSMPMVASVANEGSKVKDVVTHSVAHPLPEVDAPDEAHELNEEPRSEPVRARATRGESDREGAEPLRIPDAVTPAADERSALEEELALIDDARALLDAGKASSALGKLAEARRRFPAGSLGPEASFLEMQAHHQLGHTVLARRAAEQILKRYPNGPHAGRAREILGR